MRTSKRKKRVAKIAKTRATVEQILHDCPATRGSDVLLYLKLLDRISHRYLTQPFAVTLQDETLPSIESVGRLRRLIQEKDPSMIGDEYITQARIELEDIYHTMMR